jgi:hypothetical protein
MLFGIFATALTVSGIGKAQESATKKSSYAPNGTYLRGKDVN